MAPMLSTLRGTKPEHIEAYSSILTEDIDTADARLPLWMRRM
jgi:hypothetical protein